MCIRFCSLVHYTAGYIDSISGQISNPYQTCNLRVSEVCLVNCDVYGTSSGTSQTVRKCSLDGIPRCVINDLELHDIRKDGNGKPLEGGGVEMRTDANFFEDYKGREYHAVRVHMTLLSAMRSKEILGLEHLITYGLYLLQDKPFIFRYGFGGDLRRRFVDNIISLL